MSVPCTFYSKSKRLYGRERERVCVFPAFISKHNKQQKQHQQPNTANILFNCHSYTGAHHYGIYVTTMRKIRLSVACATWLAWIQLVLYPISYSSVMRLHRGWIHHAIYMQWYRKFCMASKHKWATKVGADSSNSSRQICPSA